MHSHAAGIITVGMRVILSLMIAFASAIAGATIRPAAVAGGFYSDDPERLRAEVERMLDVPEASVGARALVVPHAGHFYSGAVAGRAFAAIDAEGLRRVVLIGPSHHRSFTGAALPARGIQAFETPLGAVPVDVAAVESLRKNKDFAGPSAAHGPEHCLEVELPFLQVLAPDAAIVPILIGNGTDSETARRLARALVLCLS